MPALQSVGKMQLEDACDETPQAEQLLELCRQDVEEVRTFGTKFHASCSKTVEGCTAMVSGLTEMLEVAKQIHSQFSRDDETNVSFLQAQNGLQAVVVYLGEVCGIMQNMSNDLSNNMMYPIDRFMRADLEALEHRSAVHCASSEQYKETLEKYTRLPKRKTDSRSRGERYDEVRLARAQAREDTLHYFAALHSLNLKRSYLFLEPLVGFLRAFVAATRSSSEAIAKRDVDTNLIVFDTFVKSEHRDLTADQRRIEMQIDAIRNQLRAEALIPRTPEGELKPKVEEPQPQPQPQPQPPPVESEPAPQEKEKLDTSISGRSLRSQQSLQKSGYLYVKRTPPLDCSSSKSGVASFLSGSATRRDASAGVWERAFVFIQGGNLMVQGRHELAGSSLVDLQDANGLVRAEVVEHDDRFAVFAVSYTQLPGGSASAAPQSPSQADSKAAASSVKAEKKIIAYFQSESEPEREEWIRLINLNAGVTIDAASARSLSIARSVSAAPNESPSHAQRTASVTQQISVDVSLMHVRDSPTRSPHSSAINKPILTQPLDLDTALEFVPIQFDLTPADGDRAPLGVVSDAESPNPKTLLIDAILNALASPSYIRTNPFNADAGATVAQSLADEIAAVENTPDASKSDAGSQAQSAETPAASNPRFLKRFLVRFVGSMQVGNAAQHANVSRDELVSAAIRKMLHARSTHDLMQMLELSLVICEQCVALFDGTNRQGLRSFIDLQRVVQIVCHKENSRYFGFLVRKDKDAATVVSEDEFEQLDCFAFECDTGGADVYEAFKAASRTA